MDTKKISKGRFSRFFRLGSLSTIVGASYFGHKMRTFGSSEEDAAESLYNTNVKNAERIARTFGELKGAVMKVGQMMSLQAGIFPEEFTSVLSTLQQDSEPFDVEIMIAQVEKELGAPLEKLFSSFDRVPHASASIGQVHRATLPEGRDVVIKVQYPGVTAMVESDLKNLRMFFRSLGKAKLEMDVMELWDEIRERLSEELNYEIELDNMIEFKKLFASDERIIVPSPIPEYSTKHVLTMEYVPGLNGQDLMADDFDPSLRNELSVLLFETLVRQLFHFRTLQADPNLSNFAFRLDGRLVLYDFGCVKRFPVPFIETYRAMVVDGLRDDFVGVLTNFRKLGFRWIPDNAIDETMVEEVGRILLRPYLTDHGYNFGKSTLHHELFSFIRKHVSDRVKFVIPPDILFLDRVVGGMYGNMMRLHADANWRGLLERTLIDGQGSHRRPVGIGS